MNAQVDLMLRRVHMPFCRFCHGLATKRDCREWKLSAINPHDRRTWRSGVRSAMRAASQLSGRGPLVWMLPLYLHVNQKSDYDDNDDSYSVVLSHST